MGERLSRVFPWVVGVAVPTVLILTNTVWDYAGILLTIASLVWIGFALALMPHGTPA